MNKAEAKSIGLGSAKSMTTRGVVIYAPYLPLFTTPYLTGRPRLKDRLYWAYAVSKWKLRDWLMGHYRRHAYRHVQRLLHKFNLHYMPARDPITGDDPHSRYHWCQWCGIRGTTYVANPGPINNDPL